MKGKEIAAQVAGLVAAFILVVVGIFIWLKLLPELTTPFEQVMKAIIAIIFIVVGFLIAHFAACCREKTKT